MRQRLVAASLALSLTACGGLSLTPTPAVTLPDGPETGEMAPAINAYAATQRDVFGGMYLERGVMVAQFTDDLARHDAALRAKGLDPTRYRLERVTNTEADLLRLQEAIGAVMIAGDLEGVEFISSGINVFDNRVELTLKSNDPGVEGRLRAQFGDEDVLALVVAPLVDEWIQPAAGEGWQLLAHGRTVESYTVRVAEDATTYAEMWSALGLEGVAPPVDFGRSLVAAFVPGVGSSCPEVRFDGLEVRDDVVYPSTGDPLAPRVCTADLVGGQAFVVAMDRGVLPPAPFRVRLVPPDESLPCGGDCGSGVSSEVLVE